MLSLLLFFLIQPLQATTARVLVDEISQQINIEGRVRVHCLQHDRAKPVEVKPCLELNKRNKLSRYSFRKRSFLLKISRSALSLTDTSSRKKWIIYGRKFRLQGEFTWKNALITTLDIFAGSRGTHWVVQLPVNKYLQGVLSAEIPSSWPLASLKAQAVASRTYFLWKKKKRQSHFDVRSDHMDQVFKMQNEAPATIRQAVSETANIVLARKEREYFPAYYHSDCGGQTNPEDKVWLKPRANRNVADPMCRKAKRNQWSHEISRRELYQLIRKPFKLPSGIELLAILPQRKKETRAFVIDLLLANGRVKRINANEFRKALGFGKLKSTNFAVLTKGQSYVFQGRGYGHGVGMCQWGAQRWAKKGKSYQQILRHYYPMAHLAKFDFEQEWSSHSVASSHRLE